MTREIDKVGRVVDQKRHTASGAKFSNLLFTESLI